MGGPEGRQTGARQRCGNSRPGRQEDDRDAICHHPARTARSGSLPRECAVTKDIEEPSAGLTPPAGRRGTPGTGGTPRRRRRGANKQLANGLVVLSSAAIVAVYAAGYARTAPAAASLASGDAAALAVGATATTPS